MIDHERGERPRESSIEISVVLWPEEQTETTKYFFVAPLTLDLTGKDLETDVIVSDKRDIGKPFAVPVMKGHPVEDYRMLSYVGKLSERTTNRITKKAQEVWGEFMDIKKAS